MAATHPITTAIGGSRLGSGNKMNTTLHNYNRSTHDLSYAWRSTMTVGTLIPFMKFPDLNGDTWDIDLSSVIRTVPTKGPIYGSFKFQVDLFECPIRLYNALLHNNMLNLGNQMEKVIFPHMSLRTRVWRQNHNTGTREQIANDSLLKYLGISGIGDVHFDVNNDTPYIDIRRNVQAVPVMAYYDIYKNYYANKQERLGVYITAEPTTTITKIKRVVQLYNSENPNFYLYEPVAYNPDPTNCNYQQLKGNYDDWIKVGGNTQQFAEDMTLTINFDGRQSLDTIGAVFDITNPNTQETTTSAELIEDVWQNIETDGTNLYLSNPYPMESWLNKTIRIKGFFYVKTTHEVSNEILLKKFELENIDRARIAVFQNAGLNNMLMIEDLDEPYDRITEVTENGESYSNFHLNGICLKTYQSDLLNNWLQTEWINAINQSTAIDVSVGSFTIDALNFAKKLYNFKNRIAVMGGTYQDWQEAVYTANVNRMAETPIYKGGMSGEIVFSEVVNTAATDDTPLGQLAGKGGLANTKAGHVVIHCDEPSYIIGIVSITPRVDYSQGNDWDMMELHTMDDLHKPELDGIGFEDLLQERGAWFGTYWDEVRGEWVKLAIGKSPANINWMTNINKTFGEFADEKVYMTLNRRFEKPTVDTTVEEERRNLGIQDLTTYIDPRKYNYAFADARLEAQNFWVQIGVKIEARRVMSAKIIPQV